jgi:hypothetical protein
MLRGAVIEPLTPEGTDGKKTGIILAGAAMIVIL